MATQANPNVPIELDKQRTLRLDLNTFALVEEMTGLNLTEPVEWTKMSIRSLRAFLWAALSQEDSELTLNEVGAMIHVGNFGYISEKFNEALTLVLPAPKEEPEEGEVPAPKRGRPARR